MDNKAKRSALNDQELEQVNGGFVAEYESENISLEGDFPANEIALQADIGNAPQYVPPQSRT